ncbi:flagellar biosynthesis anti-sigma factor FlgM [Zhongshania sp.]|uniref:flagellar biosynthesis anti-sigma factor FlgM n=1 Tax=Zhongshania sp. TaxID=1971902 RepID=UPI0035699916
MVDRIDGSSLSQARKLDSGRTGASKSDSTVTSPDAAGTAKTAQVDTPLLERTRAQVNSSDGIDRQKVEAIKTAIRNGEFTIDANKVAAALVNMEALSGS